MRSRVYLVATFVGLLVPPILIGYYIADNGFDLVDMLNAMVDNTIALAVFCDLTIAALVFFYWAHGEAAELGIGHWWWIIPGTVFIGLCFGLPLFLYWREKALEARAASLEQPGLGA